MAGRRSRSSSRHRRRSRPPGGLVTYANSITLTPGTVTIEIDGDGTSGHSFLVHALDPSFMADVDSGDMDRRVTALEGGSTG